MNWRNRNNVPLVSENTRLLFAEFSRNGKLRKIIPGWWYAEESGGFYAPSKPLSFTHWMPYDDYWMEMAKLKRD